MMNKKKVIEACKQLGAKGNFILPESLNLSEIITKNNFNFSTKQINAKIIELEKQEQTVNTLKAFNDAILTYLDAQCSSLGFTGDSSTRPYRSVANYVGFDNVFRVDAEKLGSWIALTFQTAEKIEADVLSGARPMPTIDEVLAELPKYI